MHLYGETEPGNGRVRQSVLGELVIGHSLVILAVGSVDDHTPVVLVMAACSRHATALEWVAGRAAAEWGPVALASSPFSFVETDYYTATMGTGLQKLFFAFERLIDPGLLPSLKHQSNAWESEYARTTSHPEPRPLNLDPGYLTNAKLVLASTKDHSHRIYLAEGIYAEVTLHYKARRWQARDWTYPDYRRADYHEFFDQCRNFLRGST